MTDFEGTWAQKWAQVFRALWGKKGAADFEFPMNTVSL
jgi:hypothetical protein